MFVVHVLYVLRQENAEKRHHTECQHITGCGSAWLERLVWDQEVAGSNPVTPTTRGCSSMVEHQPSKLDTWVRFPSPASHMLYACVFVAQLDRATAF